MKFLSLVCLSVILFCVCGGGGGRGGRRGGQRTGYSHHMTIYYLFQKCQHQKVHLFSNQHPLSDKLASKGAHILLVRLFLSGLVPKVPHFSTQTAPTHHLLLEPYFTPSVTHPQYVSLTITINRKRSPTGVYCWNSVAPALQSWFAVQYSSCFISVMNLDLYVRVLIHWWVEVLHADRTTSMCLWTALESKVSLLQHKTGLRTPEIYYRPFQGDASVMVYSNCQCSSSFCLSLTYC